MNVGSLSGKWNNITMLKPIKSISIIMIMLLTFVASCDERKEHIASAIRDRDSVSMMTSYGVNTLISDSGVIKYRIVAEYCEEPFAMDFR